MVNKVQHIRMLFAMLKDRKTETESKIDNRK